MTADLASLVSDNLHIWTTAVERKSGAGRGGGKKLEHYGIERLRTLILDLAVRGKLVPQYPDDEPASELLKRIKAGSSTTSKRTKRPVRQPFEAPEGWSVLSFGELAKDISTGPFGTMIHKEDYIFGGTPLINPSHMVKDQIVEDLSVSLPSAKAEELGSYRLEPGDIVFARRGEVGRLAIVTEREAGWLCGTGSFRARFNGNDVQPYLLKFFRSQKARSFLGSESVGATMANLNQGILSELPISLPPLAEQRRIVAKVDELMALCDALEAESAAMMIAHEALVEALLATLTASTDAADLATNWSRLEAHFDTLFTTEASVDALKQAILELAVRGKLASQDADDEPVRDLLKRTSPASATKSGRVKKSAALPFKAPSGWSVLSFGELAREISTGPFGTMVHKEDYVSGGIPLINPSHMIDDRIVEDLSVSLTASKAAELGTYALEPGDIVFARRGEVGRLAIVTEREAGWLCGTGSFRARFVGNEVQPYLLKFFRSQTARSSLGRESVGATMANLNQGILSELPVPLPPLPEQRRIVARVDELIALCDVLTARITNAAATQKCLADAIVERAAA